MMGTRNHPVALDIQRLANDIANKLLPEVNDERLRQAHILLNGLWCDLYNAERISVGTKVRVKAEQAARPTFTPEWEGQLAVVAGYRNGNLVVTQPDSGDEDWGNVMNVEPVGVPEDFKAATAPLTPAQEEVLLLWAGHIEATIAPVSEYESLVSLGLATRSAHPVTLEMSYSPTDAGIILSRVLTTLRAQAEALAEREAEVERLRGAAQRLVDEYWRNKGTDDEFISCKTLGQKIPDYWQELDAALTPTQEAQQ